MDTYDDSTKLCLIADLINDYGNIDGSHHKQWVIAEIAKIILDGNYKIWAGLDFDEGIAP